MTTLPHDIPDLYLAPVVLALDARIAELGKLSYAELADTVAIEGDRPEWSRAFRETGLLRTITHLVEMHAWEAAWDPRGVRLTHDGHSVVLGVPDTFREYLADTSHDPH